jgi:cytochrome o ubiquinol oxidase operon protein cyoD
MEHRGLATYLWGFVLAVVLTAIPFYLVASHALAPLHTMYVIAAAAVLQVLVHLRFFLHLDFARAMRENLVAIAFTAILLVIMMGGSFWIMIDLYRRMAI